VANTGDLSYDKGMSIEPVNHDRSSSRDPLQWALIDLCFELGFDRVTVPMLCSRANLELAEFEARYRDLDECFHAAYAAEFGRYRREAEEATGELTDWRERLRATAYVLLRFLSEDERLTHFTVVEARRSTSTSILMGEGIEEIIDLLDEGREQPGAPATLTRATAESVAGGLFNQLYLAVGHENRMLESEVVPQAMYSAVLPYLGAQAAMQELEIPPPLVGGRRGR
jgi:AcrR family transcriptional regulator